MTKKNKNFVFVDISKVFVGLVGIIRHQGVDVVQPWNVRVEPSKNSVFFSNFNFDHLK